MTFQKEVKKEMPRGIPGTHAGVGAVVSYTRTAGADINIGRAVWLNPNNDDAVLPSGTKSIFGLATRTQTGALDCPGTSTMIIKKGDLVHITAQGNFYLELKTDASAGQKIFAKKTDGALQVADAGSDITGAVETVFKVVKGGQAGELITVSSW